MTSIRMKVEGSSGLINNVALFVTAAGQDSFGMIALNITWLDKNRRNQCVVFSRIVFNISFPTRTASGNRGAK